MSSVLFVSDAWRPQINGVVRTLEQTCAELRRRGLRAEILGPDGFPSLPCPFYPEIRLALPPPGRLEREIEARGCDHIHVATEGPLGLAALQAARRMGRVATTSCHTRFPEYLAARLPLPLPLPTAPAYEGLRRVHALGAGCMVPTERLRAELARRGFAHLSLWSRGVDAARFRPRPEAPPPGAGAAPFAGLARPIWLNVGRVAVEKNLPAFLALDLPGTKVVVGKGPALPRLRAAWPAAHFPGPLTGEALARAYAAADVFVFPSRTDTLGLVLLEAMASGLPSAAYPAPGPADVIRPGVSGILSEDLGAAALAALRLDRDACRAEAAGWSWRACTDAFLANAEAAEARARA